MDEWRDRRKAVNSGWVQGKSAWETASAWVGSGETRVPFEVQTLLASHKLSARVVVDHGIVECKTPLRYASGPRNHDLALWARNNSPTAFIGIESKANDGLGETMQNKIDAARRRRARGENTNLDQRAEWLSQSLFGISLLADDYQNSRRHERERDIRTKALQLPYQLFAGVAGTLLEAKIAQSEIAIFIVHQFRTTYTNDHDIRADAKRLHRFTSLLVEANSSQDDEARIRVPLRCGSLVGAIYLKNRGDGEWAMPTQIPLLIGEIQTDRTRS
jgi:hypothetical protein